MRKIDRIYIHCSASSWGDVAEIREWHLKRGWDDVGYHFVICNPYRNFAESKDGQVKSYSDGLIQTGRHLAIVGSHVAGDNQTSIGICYVGFSPTPIQIQALRMLCLENIQKFQIPIERVFGHYEWYLNNGQEPKKTCPNFNMDTFRKSLVT